MAASITRGKTFTASEQVTNSKLHQIVDSATIANIDRTNFDTVTRGITQSSSAPTSPITGELWWDTGSGCVRVYDGAQWVGVQNIARLTNKSGGGHVAGDTCKIDADNASAVENTTTAGYATTPICVAAATIADAAAGIYFVGAGYVPTLAVADATAIGDYLRHSTTSKKATSDTNRFQGTFAVALTTTAGAGTVSAIMLGMHIGPHMVTGTYTGDGNATQAITGLGFTPDVMIVHRNATSGTVFFRNDRMAANDSINGADLLVTSGIRTFDSDGFTVGNHADINTNAVVYSYIAWKK